ncbi:MAG: carboxypeptidase regulatory-like domain-containing protein [Flavobacteriales bacterium]|jgi:hypothetical protein|nr:carboxypeptidase regulatory-like domain-containing protein [Flavobacteriales bacterium]MBP6641533.1 carboxypeptidase regulatory-like domain-containing protein [Flavobacteriales bacterium]MBP7154626.1 carboxypeptidase regulatory-like domain-containing protein [Flavobacteriales bacterium]HQV74834.1 carboxypeptidase-like regulatory domain-containing protein [Flavobacteriales bacterium]HQW40741.1 carboxypeptidase-like regulatory domain-containing protein [Flavobacteriales bacterium]
MKPHLFILVTLAFFVPNAGAQDTLKLQLHGMVVDAISGAPVVDALVEWNDGNGRRQAVTQANSDGHYALFIRTTGTLILRVEQEGYSILKDTLRDFRQGESAREYDLLLMPVE